MFFSVHAHVLFFIGTNLQVLELYFVFKVYILCRKAGRPDHGK